MQFTSTTTPKEVTRLLYSYPYTDSPAKLLQERLVTPPVVTEIVAITYSDPRHIPLTRWSTGIYSDNMKYMANPTLNVKEAIKNKYKF